MRCGASPASRRSDFWKKPRSRPPSVRCMGIDLEAARQFIESTARVLERHQLAVLLDDGPIEPVLTALKAYQNADGGFGHALEPDVRCPGSQPSAALSALDVLA